MQTSLQALKILLTRRIGETKSYLGQAFPFGTEREDMRDNVMLAAETEQLQRYFSRRASGYSAIRFTSDKLSGITIN